MNRLCLSRQVLFHNKMACQRSAAAAAATPVISSSSLYYEPTTITAAANPVISAISSSSLSNSQPQIWHCQRIQYRYFDSRKRRKRKKGADPFKVLKIPEGILYKDAKKKFLMIAMKNHPDTVHDHTVTDEERDEMREIFIKSRIAFEELVEDESTGNAIRKSEAEECALENFDSWFKNETGFETPFQFDIDPETMKEVASMTETIGGDSGLDRDGGMWALARLVTNTVKAGGDAATMLRLDAGDPKDPRAGRPQSLSGELRRRRRR